MAAVPSIGRANRIEGAPAPEADLTQALYEQYAAQILRYCMHQLGSREEAEDAVQSTFLNAFRGIKRGIVPETESAWLFSIAHNVCLSRRRSTWRRGRIEAPTDFDIVEELAPAPSRRADELIGLQGVLEGMPEQQRRAILLREWQGLSYREIAEEMELSQSAVETLIFRARRSLAQGLEQPVAEPKRRKRMHAGVLGNLLSSAQSFLIGGGAAVKVAAAVAVVSAGTVVATAPVQTHAPVKTKTTAPAVHHAPAPVPTGGTSGAAARPANAGGVQRAAASAHHVAHATAATVTPLVPPAQTPTQTPTQAPNQAPTQAPTETPAPVDPPTAPVAGAPSVTPTQPTAAPPAVTPAQPQDTAPPADSKGKGKDAAPGQTKPGQTKPGQTKKSDDPPAAVTPAVTPAPSPAPAPAANGKTDAPGQAKQKDDPPGQVKKEAAAVPPPAAPAPAVTTSTVTTTAATPDAAPAPAPTAAAPAAGNGKPDDPGKAKGNGKEKEKDK